jgi:hypothetical protein
VDSRQANNGNSVSGTRRSFAFFQLKRKKTVAAFFSKVEIHSLSVAGLGLHSDPEPVLRPRSGSVRWAPISMNTQDH